MSREWKPGDVAMVNGRVCIRTSGDWANAEGWEHGDRLTFRFADHEDLDIRPLVTIDPEDVEQVERLWTAWRDLAPDHRLAQDNLVAALREYADPPKPDEPLGLGAVVEADNGRRFIRQHDGWWRGDQPRTLNWTAVHAVRVLSHGVTEGEL